MDEQKKIPHNLFLSERKHIEISGVKDVDSFDEGTLIVFAERGEIMIKGENIKVSSYSVETGDLAADGMFNSISYSERLPKGSGLFAKVFK